MNIGIIEMKCCILVSLSFQHVIMYITHVLEICVIIQKAIHGHVIVLHNTKSKFTLFHVRAAFDHEILLKRLQISFGNFLFYTRYLPKHNFLSTLTAVTNIVWTL